MLTAELEAVTTRSEINVKFLICLPNVKTTFEFDQEPTPQSAYSHPILTWKVFRLTKRHPINNDSTLSNAPFHLHGRGQQTVPAIRSGSRFAPTFRAADASAASGHTGATNCLSPIQGRRALGLAIFPLACSRRALLACPVTTSPTRSRRWRGGSRPPLVF